MFPFKITFYPLFPYLVFFNHCPVLGNNINGHLPIDIVAEHGAMIKENKIWKERIKSNFKWKHEFLPVLSQFTLECEGSFIEEKRFSVAWHYRNVNTMG